MRMIAEILLGGGILGAGCGWAICYYLDRKFGRKR